MARGAGTRMRASAGIAHLSPAQQRAAAAGHKALMPIGDRPFLDFVLRAIAAAGIDDAALIVAPDHSEMHAAYPKNRAVDAIDISWVVQREPRGTANAVAAAEEWAAGDSFLVMNGDNLYPTAAVAALCQLDQPGVAAFDRANLIATSNIPEERLNAFAILRPAADDSLEDIVEKPSGAVTMNARVSMNLWRFDARIFSACRDVTPSPRGEFELPTAVMLARERGVRFQVVPANGPVLDLSKQTDVADVARRLLGMEAAQ